MVEAFLKIRPCIHEAIDVMLARLSLESQTDYPHRGVSPLRWQESLNKTRKELVGLRPSAKKCAAVAQAKAVWEVAVRHKLKTACLFRERSPVSGVLFQICALAGVPYQRTLSDKMRDRDYSLLTYVVGKLGASPIVIADVSQPGAFAERLSALTSCRASCFVVCDWTLNDEELEAARRAARDFRMAFTCLG